MEIRNIIKTVLKESYVEKVQKTLDKYGLATTLKMFGNDVNKLSKMLNMSEIELLEKYNPFETIFTDEEFENSLFDTMTFIKDKPNIFYPKLKNNPINEVVEYIIDITIDDFHSKLVNFETLEWIIPETPKLLYLRYGDLLKNNSLFKKLYKQYTSNTRKLDEEMSEYARTLKNARKQGSGLRFPKSAIKANPNRFRPYSREQVDESLHKVKHFYGFLGLPNYWVDDNDKSYSEKYFNDKEYEDKIFDNFFDMDKEFGHKNSLFGTRGLEPRNPNRTSKSFNEYVKRFGLMIVRILKKENIQESIKKIKCQCGWSWKLKDGGNDPYTCHKCGHNNSKKYIKEDTNRKLLAYQKLVDTILDDLRYGCKELNSESEEIISFDACDFIEPLTEMKVVDITIDGTVQVILKYNFFRYIDYDPFIYEFKHELKKYGNVKIDVIDSINTHNRQW